MEDKKLIAKKRDLEGTSNSRRLRKLGSVPAIIYGGGKDPVSTEVNAHAFKQIMQRHSSESVILEVALDGEGDISVLVKAVQHHPVSVDILHIDFQRVVAGQSMTFELPIVLVGDSVGVKGGGVLDHVMHSITIECLPRDLVESFDVDISDMDIGDALHAVDLDLGDKFKVLVDDNAIIATMAAPTVADDEDEDGDAASEPEVITEKKEDA